MADSPARDGRQGGDRILVDLPHEIPYGTKAVRVRERRLRGGPARGRRRAHLPRSTGQRVLDTVSAALLAPAILPASGERVPLWSRV